MRYYIEFFPFSLQKTTQLAGRICFGYTTKKTKVNYALHLFVDKDYRQWGGDDYEKDGPPFLDEWSFGFGPFFLLTVY